MRLDALPRQASACNLLLLQPAFATGIVLASVIPCLAACVFQLNKHAETATKKAKKSNNNTAKNKGKRRRERERGAASDWAIAPKDKQQQELMPIKWEF